MRSPPLCKVRGIFLDFSGDGRCGGGNVWAGCGEDGIFVVVSHCSFFLFCPGSRQKLSGFFYLGSLQCW
jgi:hypothetical protein